MGVEKHFLQAAGARIAVFGGLDQRGRQRVRQVDRAQAVGIRLALARSAPRDQPIVAAGLRIDDSEAGLYLWATAGEPSRVTVDRLADLGILVAPGDFYGVAGEQHVRVALSATDERIAAAVARLDG